MNLPAELHAELPAFVRDSLEMTCFAPQTREARDLAAHLDAYVVSYERNHPERSEGKVELCQTLAMADLPDRGLALLRATEDRLDATLVAYAKPVRWVSRIPGGA